MRILTAEAMQTVDHAVIHELGIPSLVLMENAATAVTEALAESYPEAERVVIFCGPGNNGGDGFAVGRQLTNRGYQVELIWVPGGSTVPKPGTDVERQWTICRRLDVPVLAEDPVRAVEAWMDRAAEADVVVDAIFGTGLKRRLKGRYAETVQGLNQLDRPVVAVDLPSGLDASSDLIPGPHVEAVMTVTFAAPKVAHVFAPAALAAGEVVVADIGIPHQFIERPPGDLRLLTASQLALGLGPRDPAGHKGDFGHSLLLAGSTGKSGAAVLAAQAAVRAGSGLVTVAVPEPIVQAVDAGSIESMTVSLPASRGGELGRGSAEAFLELCQGKASLAIGPGLGLDQDTVVEVRRLVLETELPLVLDADGLNVFAGAVSDLAGRPGPLILTPHPGELGRLLAQSTDQVAGDLEKRLEATRRCALSSGAIVVLKGHRTLVADPLGGVYVNPTGNPGMATGGSGDVLTGLIVGLLAQRFEPLAAAQLGVFVHGLAGDLAVKGTGETALAASDLMSQLPAALQLVAQS